MDVSLLFLAVLSAFFLFALLLPLFGFVAGLFCYYVLPYVFGGLLMLALLLLTGVKMIMTWWVWLFALVWATSVHYVRSKLRDLGHEIEHYHAAHIMLLAGIPFHRRKNRLQSENA